MSAETKRIIGALVVAVVMLAVGFAGGYLFREAQYPGAPAARIVLVDDLGRNVTLSKPAERIVSVAAAATRTLYDLGVFDKVVGVDKYSDDPPEAQNKTIVDYKDPESILACEPDLVIAWWYQQKYLQQVEDAGIPVIYIHPTSIEGIYYDIMLIGKAVGAEDRAISLVSNLKMRVTFIENFVKCNLTATYPRPKVYLELYSPYKTVGRGTFTHQMIELAGGINIAGNLTISYPKLSDEYIIKANPDVILYESDLPVENFTNRPGWDQINAVKNNRIYHLDRHIATASPRFVEGLEFMVWAFFGVNMSEIPEYPSLASSSVSSPHETVSTSAPTLMELQVEVRNHATLFEWSCSPPLLSAAIPFRLEQGRGSQWRPHLSSK